MEQGSSVWVCSTFKFLHELSLDRRELGQILSSSYLLFVRKDRSGRRVLQALFEKNVKIYSLVGFDIAPERTDSFDVTKYGSLFSISEFEGFEEAGDF